LCFFGHVCIEHDPIRSNNYIKIGQTENLHLLLY